MAQFNIVKGDSSRISTEITPFQDGRFYLTNDGGLYVDTVVDGENKRIHLNPTTGGGSMSYARTFVTGDWTAGASESTLSIPASDHGLTGDIIDCQAFSLHYGAHVTNTWAAVQTSAKPADGANADEVHHNKDKEAPVLASRRHSVVWCRIPYVQYRRYDLEGEAHGCDGGGGMMGGACAPSHSVHHETIHFTPEMIRGICSMDDFYKATGIAELVKDKTITDVRQVWMNKQACEGLEDIVEGNLKRQKKYRLWSDHALHTAVAMDWLCYSPAGIDYVPDGELWIWTLEDAEIAIEEYRNWRKETSGDDQEKDR